MFLGIRKRYWIYLSVALLLIGLVLFMNLSPVFAWQASGASGPYAEKVRKLMDQRAASRENVFRVNKWNVLDELLAIDEVEKATLRLTIPGGLAAEVNHFDPVALVYDGREGLSALDRYCRLIPYDRGWENVDLPVLTGLKLDGLFNVPVDYRVAEVIGGLREIERDLPEFYCQIAEVDFSDAVYLTISLNSSRKRFLAGGSDFDRQMIKLHAVRPTDDWDVEGCYNLVYDGVVVRQERN